MFKTIGKLAQLLQSKQTSTAHASGSGRRNEVIALIALALRNNPIREISNDYDAKRIATAWVSEQPPQFMHESIGGMTLQTTAIGEAFFLLASRLNMNFYQTHSLYEEGAITYLLALSQSQNVANRMTALDAECLRDAALALRDAKTNREQQ